MAGRTDNTMVLTCISMLGNNIVSAVYKSLYIIMLYRSCITSSTPIVMVWIIGQSFFRWAGVTVH